MSPNHRRIPVLPECPRVHPIADQINRSYSVGRQSFSRACQGEVMKLTISLDNPIQETIQAKLVTTMNSTGRSLYTVPFNRFDTNTQICQVTPKRPGLFSFHAEFSLDKGITWLRDTVPDAWVLVDPPQVDDLKIYTLIPTVSGTVLDWKADLKRIQDMGFNAVHLLPITALDTSESPYSAKDLFEINSSGLLAQ